MSCLWEGERCVHVLYVHTHVHMYNNPIIFPILLLCAIIEHLLFVLPVVMTTATMSIHSKKSHPDTDSEKFGQTLLKTLSEMQVVFSQ